MFKQLKVHPYGAIAQLGERIVRNDEVVGSIPTSSTNTRPLTQLAPTNRYKEPGGQIAQKRRPQCLWTLPMDFQCVFLSGERVLDVFQESQRYICHCLRRDRKHWK